MIGIRLLIERIFTGVEDVLQQFDGLVPIAELDIIASGVELSGRSGSDGRVITSAGDGGISG